jgi:hypothetical protein
MAAQGLGCQMTPGAKPPHGADDRPARFAASGGLAGKAGTWEFGKCPG